MTDSSKVQLYQDIKTDELIDELGMFQQQFKKYLALSGYAPDTQIAVSTRALVDAVIRTHKRKAYYRFFHNNMEISECKIAALYAYWIIKYRPFTITDARYVYNNTGMCINEYFAVYMICCIILHCHEPVPTKVTKSTFFRKLLYSFRFRNLSIDSMILLVESICPESFDRHFEDIV